MNIKDHVPDTLGLQMIQAGYTVPKPTGQAGRKGKSQGWNSTACL